MRLRILIAAVLFSVVLPVWAQQISVDEFARIKKPLLRPKSVKTDKKQAVLDLYTTEQGFSFLADGKQVVQPEEGEGILILLVPHRTAFLVIKHDAYGQTVWKVPDKGLRKKRRYRASLHTASLEKEFKIGKQWLALYVQPEWTVVQIDSVVETIHSGCAQFYLPVGRHTLRVEAPFYKEFQDTISLTDTLRLEKRVELQPFYSYLTVRTPVPAADICLDGERIGQTDATSRRLMPGSYRLTVIKDSLCFYDKRIEIAEAEKKVIDLTDHVLSPWLWRTDKKILGMEVQPDEGIHAESRERVVRTQVSIKAPDEDTEIWLNRELTGKGHWQGMLEAGFYAVNTRKDGLESDPVFLWVEAGVQQELNLAAPLADYGWMNVYSNEVDAEVLLNGVCVGRTPCILSNLPVSRDYVVTLQKCGYRKENRIVRLHGNEMSDVRIELKKEK